MIQTDLTLPQLIEPGASLTVHVTLTPDVNKTFCGSFSFTTNDLGLPTVTMAIQANILWPAMIYTPSSLTFPSTGVGNPSTQRIEIDNRGQGSLRVT